MKTLIPLVALYGFLIVLYCNGKHKSFWFDAAIWLVAGLMLLNAARLTFNRRKLEQEARDKAEELETKKRELEAKMKQVIATQNQFNDTAKDRK